MQEYDKAITEFEDVLEEDPEHTLTIVQMAAALLSKGEGDKAITLCVKALEIDPKFVEAYIQRGIAYRSKSEFEKSIEDFDVALRIAPKHDFAFAQRGMTRRRLKRFDKAIEDYSEAIRLNPKHAVYRSIRARAWREKGDYEKTIEDETAAMKLEPGNPIFMNGYAWTLATCPVEKFRDGELALQLARKACEATGWKNGTFIDTYAAALAETGNFEEAVKQQIKANESFEAGSETHDSAVKRLESYMRGKPWRDAEV